MPLQPWAMLTATTKKLARLDERKYQVIKQECFSRQNNKGFWNKRASDVPKKFVYWAISAH